MRTKRNSRTTVLLSAVLILMMSMYNCSKDGEGQDVRDHAAVYNSNTEI